MNDIKRAEAIYILKKIVYNYSEVEEQQGKQE